jgi:hypothetical protein
MTTHDPRQTDRDQHNPLGLGYFYKKNLRVNQLVHISEFSLKFEEQNII